MIKFSSQDTLVSLEILCRLVIADLLDCVPNFLRHYLCQERWIILNSLQDIASMKRVTGPVALTIPSSEVLLREIEVPLVSSFQLGTLLQYEAPLYVPIPLETARLDFRVLHRDLYRARMRVQLAIIKAEAVEAALEQVRDGYLEASAIAISTRSDTWIARRPLQLPWHLKWFSKRRRRLASNIAIPLFLIIALVAAAQHWSYRVASDREGDLILAQSQAVGVEALRQKLAILNQKISFLNEVKARPSAGQITEEVARLLPDDAWLGELNINDQTLQLQGESVRATDLLRIFSASPLFANVQFEAPLTTAQGQNDQQFDITMTVK